MTYLYKYIESQGTHTADPQNSAVESIMSNHFLGGFYHRLSFWWVKNPHLYVPTSICLVGYSNLYIYNIRIIYYILYVIIFIFIIMIIIIYIYTLHYIYICMYVDFLRPRAWFPGTWTRTPGTSCWHRLEPPMRRRPV